VIVLRGFGVVLRGLANLTFLAIPVGLAIALLPYFDGAASYPWINRVSAFDAMIMDSIRSVVPTRIGQLDLGRAFVLVALLFAGLAMDFGANHLVALKSSEGRQRKRRQPRKSKQPTEKKTTPRDRPSKASAQGDGGAVGEPKSREELVRLMVEAKRKLDAMTREVAFLALDVVESTNMKVGEDPAFVEHDFKHFKHMVDEAVAKYRPLKSAWTPDGAMICFDSLDGAVRAGQAMLKALPEFNAGTRMMQTPFRVRCGVNGGRVQYDESTPMEAMSDNVIDVAGHMQKYAEPDTIFAAGELLRRQKVTRGFVPTGTEVDGFPVVVWRGPSADPTPRSAGDPATPSDPGATVISADDTMLSTHASGAPASLGKYEVRRELGRGAMGIVYEGWDPGIERRVALKTVRPDQLDSGNAAQLVERFRREAQAAGRLSHPGIVSVYDFGQEGDTSFIAMEYIEGDELQSWLDRGESLQVSQVVEIMCQLLDALDAAGREGVVHRDIKPANILLLPDGRVKITDFGIARVEASGLTQAGAVVGTPAYMSPEQLRGDEVDARSDLFSAGVVLYQMLTGERPFAGNRVATIIHKILEIDPPDPSKLALDVPEAFDAVIRTAIAKSPEDRYQSGAEFAAAIREAAAGE
jgi:predicted Ser/Thr protein kinase/class 3 adenylate cyclase